jgi:hypothetical protein
MKKLPLNAFIWLFNLTFYLFVIAALLFAVIEVSRWLMPNYVASYSFDSIRPSTLETFQRQEFDIVAARDQILNPQLVTEKWRITFESKDLPVKMYMSVIALLHMLYALAILIFLRSFVLSLKNNEAFTLQNIKRLQKLGTLLILIEPLRGLSRLIRRQWIIDHLNISFTDYSIGHLLGYALGSGAFIWNWILAGLLVLTIAGVFKHGLKLKEEVDLTV